MPNIDFAALRAARQPQLAAPIAPQQPQRHEWVRYAAFAIAAILLALWLSGRGPTPTPGPGPNPIDAEGLHVLIVRDPSKTITAGQASVVNSTAVADWAKSNSAKFRRYDVADDLTKEDRVWREMRALVTDPPSLVTLKNKRANVGPIPDGIPAATAQLERLK